MIVSNIDETNKDLVLNSIRTMGDSLGRFQEIFLIPKKRSLPSLIVVKKKNVFLFLSTVNVF